MKILAASFDTVVLRYYLVMAIVISTFMMGKMFIGLVLAFPVFLSAILGVVLWTPAKSKIKQTSVTLQMEGQHHSHAA